MRRALSGLLDTGSIAEARVFSLELRLHRGETDAVHQLLSILTRFRPDVVVAQHLGSTNLRAEEFQRIRDTGDFKFIYHEGDPYSRWLHPLPETSKLAGKTADITFTTGTGQFTKNFVSAGAKDVRWMPSAFDPGSFGDKPISSAEHRDFDVIMIANRNSPRLAFRALPGSAQRQEFVSILEQRFGKRFAIYGRGWSGSSARGPISYLDQASVIQSGWVSANWDHYPLEPNYFSDRLAISLASGTVHATTLHDGYSDFFEPIWGGMATALNPAELADRIEDRLATTSPHERVEIAHAGRELAHAKLRQDDQFAALVSAAGFSVAMDRQGSGARYEMLEEI